MFPPTVLGFLLLLCSSDGLVGQQRLGLQWESWGSLLQPRPAGLFVARQLSDDVLEPENAVEGSLTTLSPVIELDEASLRASVEDMQRMLPQVLTRGLLGAALSLIGRLEKAGAGASSADWRGVLALATRERQGRAARLAFSRLADTVALPFKTYKRLLWLVLDDRHARSDDDIAYVHKLLSHGRRNLQAGEARQMYHIVLDALANGDADDRSAGLSEAFLEEMQDAGLKPNAVSYCIMVKTYGRQRDAQKLDGVVNRIADEFVELDAPLFNAIIQAHIACGDLDLAAKTIRKVEEMWRQGILGQDPRRSVKIPKPNTRTYNILLNGYAEADDIVSCFRVLRQMQERGVPADEITANTIISGLHSSWRLRRMAGLASETDFKRVFSVLPKLRDLGVPRPTSEGYTSLISAAADAGDVETAAAVVTQMHCDGLTVGIHAYTTLMRALLASGRIEAGLGVFDYLRQSDPASDNRPTIVTYNALLRGLCQSGRPDALEEAIRRFEAMQNEDGIQPTIVSYNIVLDGLASNSPPMMRHAEKILERWLAVQKQGPRVDAVTFSTLLKGYGRAGETDRAMRVWERAKRLRISLDTAAYNCYLGALLRGGELREAVIFLNDWIEQCGSVQPRTSSPIPNHASFSTVIHELAGNESKFAVKHALSLYSTMRKDFPDIIPDDTLVDCVLGLGLGDVTDQDDGQLARDGEAREATADVAPKTSALERIFERHGWNKISSGFRPL